MIRGGGNLVFIICGITSNWSWLRHERVFWEYKKVIELTAEQSSKERHWNSPKKGTPHPKTKEKPQWDSRRGTITIKIKSHNHWVGDSQTGEQLYHRNPPTGVKVLSLMSGSPTWGSSNERRNSQRIRHWRLLGFDWRTLTGLGETETPLLKGTHKVVCI